MLDYFLLGKVFCKEGGAVASFEDKVEMAREECNRIKRILSALRYLWRNGNSFGRLINSVFTFPYFSYFYSFLGWWGFSPWKR